MGRQQGHKGATRGLKCIFKLGIKFYDNNSSYYID